jgi:predicted 3-demethylubiquinone-9 3-methyltransferase (glyoxalase superfamily)
MMKKITPCLIYSERAEEAAEFYASVFSDAEVGQTTYYGPDEPGAEGSVRTVWLKIQGEDLVLVNGGPYFQFTEGISLYIDCKDQAEIDDLWERLSEGGEKQMCGWVKDKFGVSWQIGSNRILELLNDPDVEKSQRITRAQLQMTKIDLSKIEEAAAG